MPRARLRSGPIESILIIRPSPRDRASTGSKRTTCSLLFLGLAAMTMQCITLAWQSALGAASLAASAAGISYARAISEYPIRHRVKPGITGWAQVNGWRGETTTIEQIRQRVEHDLYYIENWSLTLDLIILGRTIFAVLSRANAI